MLRWFNTFLRLELGREPLVETLLGLLEVDDVPDGREILQMHRRQRLAKERAAVDLRRA